MDYKKLRKRLIVESAAGLGALAVLGGAVFYVDSVSDDSQKQAQDLQNQVNGINAETTGLRDKFTEVQQSTALYEEAMQKNGGNLLTIDHQALKDAFNRFKMQYHLGTIRLSMAPIEDMKDPAWRRKTSVINGAEVTVGFEALSDDYVYAMIQAMQRQLPGSGKITQLKLTRNSGLTDDILRTISQKGTSPLSQGELKFNWLGIRPIETPTSATGTVNDAITKP